MRASELKSRHPLAVVRVGPTRQSERGLEHFTQICSRWLGLGVVNLRLRRVFKKSGIFCPWLRCRSVVDVYPLLRNALPWAKSSRSTGYNFSQTALAAHAASALRLRKNLHTAVGGLIQLGSTLRHGVAIIGVGEVDAACELAVFSPAVEMR